MTDEGSRERIVLARLRFSKGDLFLVEAVRAFADEAEARAWTDTPGAQGQTGGWPDWVEYAALRERGGRYFELSGREVVTIQEQG